MRTESYPARSLSGACIVAGVLRSFAVLVKKPRGKGWIVYPPCGPDAAIRCMKTLAKRGFGPDRLKAYTKSPYAEEVLTLPEMVALYEEVHA